MKDNLYHESHLVIYKKGDYCWISPLLHNSILCIPVTCHLSVRFNPNQMMPENGMISNETCTRFVADQNMQKEQYSSFRIDIPVEKLDFINVTVLGENITCGYDLYVMPLNTAETTTWKGIWVTCPLLQTTTATGMNKRCVFRCQCHLALCKEIQVYKRLRNYEEGSWILCYVCVSYKIQGDYIIDKFLSFTEKFENNKCISFVFF